MLRTLREILVIKRQNWQEVRRIRIDQECHRRRYEKEPEEKTGREH